MLELNAKAVHTLFIALGERECNKVSICNSAKEILDKLDYLHKEKKLKDGNSTNDDESVKFQPSRQDCLANSSS